MFEGIAAVFSLGLLGAIALLFIGMVVPNLVLPGKDRSRIDAVKVYLSLCIFTLFGVYFFSALEKGAVVGVTVNGAISLFGGYAAFRTWTGLTKGAVDGMEDSAKKQEEPRPQRIETSPPVRVETPPPLWIDDHVPVKPSDEPEEELPRHFIPERMFIDSGVPAMREESLTTTQDVATRPPAIGPSGFIWAGTECTIVIDKFQIRDPLTYWSNGTPGYNEASCLYTSLPVGEPNVPDTPKLPYYPRYDQIQPDQRARYLEWLSGGRSGNLDEIGYAFLYFYGLERRLLIEKQDAESIIPEVKRLLDRYPHSSSFNTYLGNFLAYHAASQIETLTADRLSEIFPDLFDLSEEGAKAALAWHSHNQQPLPWPLAYSTALHFSEQRIPSALKKDRYNLALLFSQRYRSQFGAGIIPVASKRPYKMTYRPANPNLIGYYATERTAIQPVAIPNPLGRASQFNTLFSLWESCIQELRPFSTQIAKTGGELSRQAYQCLPAELKAVTLHPDKARWDALLRRDATDPGSAIVPVSILAELIEIEKRDRLTPGQSRSLNQTANDAGYQILPDVRLAGRPYLWDENVVLVPFEPGAGRSLSAVFESTALMLELGIGIAASDGAIDPAELDHLHSVVDVTSNLTSFEQGCVRALERLFVLSPPSMTGLGERLKRSLDPERRMTVAQFLVEIATIDRTVDQGERKALGRIFKALEIGENQLTQLLAASLHPEPEEKPVTVLKGGPWLAGEALPPQPEVVGSFFIDEKRLLDTKIATQDVIDILNKVFNSEEQEREREPSEEELAIVGKTEEEAVSKPSGSPTSAFSDLLPRYVPILEELLTADFWTQSDFLHLVKNHQCMPDPTAEAINTWSDEQHGDFLLEEEDGGFRINRSILST